MQLGHFEWSAGEAGRRHFLEKKKIVKMRFRPFRSLFALFFRFVLIYTIFRANIESP